MKKENLEERRMEWLGRKLVPLTKERSMPMGMADTVTKAYMRKNNIFADAFNCKRQTTRLAGSAHL